MESAFGGGILLVVPRGAVLPYYMTDSFRQVALIRLLRSHLPPRGRLWVVPCIIRRYNITGLHGVGRAFPEGEGGPGVSPGRMRATYRTESVVYSD